MINTKCHILKFGDEECTYRLSPPVEKNEVILTQIKVLPIENLCWVNFRLSIAKE